MIPNLGNIPAVILAGGLGTRLRSVVTDRPKVLAAVCGKPFLAYLLDQVAAAGITRTILCVGYRGEQIQAVLGETYAGMCLAYSHETTRLGTGGALRLAWPLIAAETLIAMNGDSFCEVNLTDLWAWHQARRAKATLVLTPRPDTTRYGRVALSTDGAISGFEEKDSTAGAGWANAGIYVLDSEMVHAIPAGRAVSLEHEVFPGWVGQRLYGYQSRGRFLDIGTPESYTQADALFSLERR
jgi:D-glycero-alpha-D-manno-heptose 1-phosphate guanylyltransferase